MSEELHLILNVAVAVTVALVGGLIAHRLRQSVIVGYLLAGVVIGPFTPGGHADPAIASELAEVGVILLMFGVGIHFSLRDLLRVRAVAIPGAVGQISVATALGAGAARWWGWSWGEALVLGLALSVASTVVLLRSLENRREPGTEQGHVAIGWLIVGVRVVPWLLARVARTESRELFTLGVLAIALGIAYGSAEYFSVSLALGAFLAGVVANESDLGHRAAEDALSLRDAFAVLFFVSVGMLFDPAVLRDAPAGALLSITLNPLLFAAVDPLERHLGPHYLRPTIATIMIEAAVSAGRYGQAEIQRRRYVQV